MANSFFGRDMAVDLGTANTLVYVRGKGVLLDEPSRRRDQRQHRRDPRGRPRGQADDRPHAGQHRRDPPAEGRRDRRLRGHREDAALLHPAGAPAGGTAKPRMVICVPSGITAVEQRAVQEAAGYQAGARRVYIIEEPMAAAIGAGLPVHEPDRQHDRRHRRRHHRGRRHLARRHRHQPVRPHRRRRPRPGDHRVHEEGVLPRCWASAPPRRSRWPSARRARCPTSPRPRSAAATWSPGCPRTVVLSSAEVRQALEEPLHAIVDAVTRHPRQDAARAGRRHHGAGHRADRWRRPAARPATSGCATRRACPSTSPRTAPARSPWARASALEEFEALAAGAGLGAEALLMALDQPGQARSARAARRSTDRLERRSLAGRPLVARGRAGPRLTVR